jgi:undecaprenyl-diphosphatase
MVYPARLRRAEIKIVDTILQTILLGVIEGITEFLPISSTGHLLIAEHWLGARSELFNVFIQLGAILAVTLIYRERLWNLSRHIHARENRDYVATIAIAFLITVVGGFGAKKLGLELPDTVQPVAWALIIGGCAILLIEARAAHWPETAALSWRVAVAVGVGQVVAAVFPGTSRSAATIFAAMMAGMTSRAAATEFSFLVGIPTMFAASAYELLKLYRHPDPLVEPLSELAIGFIVSAVVAFVAVKWLLSYIRTHRFTPFAWYRIILGAALLILLADA